MLLYYYFLLLRKKNKTLLLCASQRLRWWRCPITGENSKLVLLYIRAQAVYNRIEAKRNWRF